MTLRELWDNLPEQYREYPIHVVFKEAQSVSVPLGRFGLFFSSATPAEVLEEASEMPAYIYPPPRKTTGRIVADKVRDAYTKRLFHEGIHTVDQALFDDIEKAVNQIVG